LEYPSNGTANVFLRPITNNHQIDVLAVPGGRLQMNFMQQRAASHGDLAV
jgi:hypothetical protein